MSDTETTPSHAAEEHSDLVTRVMATVSRRISAGDDAHEALRDTLGTEGVTLTELPEVGMWFAMSQMGASFAAPSAAPEPVVDLTGADGDAVQIDLRDLSADAVPDTAEHALPVTSTPTAAPVAAPDAATRRRRANRFGAFLRATLDDRRTREAIRGGLDAHSVTTPPAAAEHAPPIEPAIEPATEPAVEPAVEPVTAVATEVAPEVAVEPDDWQVLHDGLRTLDADFGSIAMPDPAAVGTAVPAPYWSPRVTRAVRDGAALRSSIAATDVAATVDRSLTGLAPSDAVGTARPEPYWPRHVVRAGRVPEGRAVPRSSARLERDVARRFAIVRLAGQAELGSDRVEIALALAAAVPRQGVDQVATRWPATLLAGLVLGIADSVDDELVAELVRVVGLDDLSTSNATRRRRTLDLHLALRERLDVVAHEVTVARAAGATTARDVARFWALGGAAARDRLGETNHDLFVWTPVGEAVLSEILAIVDDPDAGGRRGEHTRLQRIPTGPRRALSPTTADAIRSAVRDVEAISTLRVPQVHLPPRDGAPVVILPAGTGRWHLNGELLGYGALGDDKTVALSPPRHHGWAITSRAAGGRSDVDVLVRSAATGDTVLVFDELGRIHPPELPLSGAVATIVAPAGSSVEPTATDDVVRRRALEGAWAGFERIEIDPVTNRGRWRLVTPQRSRVDLTVDRTIGAAIFAQILGGVAGRRRQTVVAPTAVLALDGHPHPADTVQIVVRAGRRRHEPLWSSLAEAGTPHRRALPLVDLAGGSVELTVGRVHHDPASAAFVVAPASLSADGTRLELDDGWCSAPPFLDLDATQRAQPIELRHGERRLRLRARLSATGPSEPRDHEWWRDPAAAAALDDWSDAAAADRWRRWTGWTPPMGSTIDDGVEALRRLVEPLLRTVDGIANRPQLATRDGSGPPIALPYAALRAEEWERSATIDGPALAEWAERFGRFARQMRVRDDASRNLEPLWQTVAGPAGPLVDLVAVAVVAHGRGPHAAAARRSLGKAAATAPAATTAATVFGIAYTTLQRTHPPTRFRSPV